MHVEDSRVIDQLVQPMSQPRLPVLGPRLLVGGRQRLPRRMLSDFSSAREAFTADDMELFVGRLREPSRARAGSALYRHFIQPEAARIMTGSYRGRRLGTPTLVLLGADDPNVRPEFILGVEDHVDALHTEIVAGASPHGGHNGVGASQVEFPR